MELLTRHKTPEYQGSWRVDIWASFMEVIRTFLLSQDESSQPKLGTFFQASVSRREELASSFIPRGGQSIPGSQSEGNCPVPSQHCLLPFCLRFTESAAAKTDLLSHGHVAGCRTQDIGPRRQRQEQETTGSWLSTTYNLFLGNQEFLSTEDQRWEVLNSTWPFPMCPESSGLPSKRQPYFSILSYEESVMSEADREAQQWGTVLPWKY